MVCFMSKVQIPWKGGIMRYGFGLVSPSLFSHFVWKRGGDGRAWCPSPVLQPGNSKPHFKFSAAVFPQHWDTQMTIKLSISLT